MPGAVRWRRFTQRLHGPAKCLPDAADGNAVGRRDAAGFEVSFFALGPARVQCKKARGLRAFAVLRVDQTDGVRFQPASFSGRSRLMMRSTKALACTKATTTADLLSTF
jgi:hypothetical protein